MKRGKFASEDAAFQFMMIYRYALAKAQLFISGWALCYRFLGMASRYLAVCSLAIESIDEMLML